MLSNATITGVERKTGVADTGTALYDAPEDLAVRAMVPQVSNIQKWNLGATIKEAAWCVLLGKSAWAGKAALGTGDRVTVRLDGGDEAAKRGEVVVVNDVVAPGGGGLSHWELYLKPV
jgi:hypothetical protein